MGLIQRALKVGKKYQNPVPTTILGGSRMFRILWLYLTNREERVPKKPLGPFRTDTSIYRIKPASGLRVTWMGHSSTLVEIDGMRVLIDPMWDERASPVSWGGPKRFFPLPFPMEDLPRVDAILLSHDHYDHLGSRTVRRLAKLESTAGALWVTSLGVGAILAKFGVNPDNIREMDWTDVLRVEGKSPVDGEAKAYDGKAAPYIDITALPARHFSGRSALNRFETLWSSFVLRGPRRSVYYGADSGEWAGMREIGEQYGPFDLSMLEIGAFNTLWADIHAGPDGAARIFKELGGLASTAGVMMPIHWGLFDLALHAWRQPIERIFSYQHLKIWAPEPGVPSEVVPGMELRSRWWR